METCCYRKNVIWWILLFARDASLTHMGIPNKLRHSRGKQCEMCKRPVVVFVAHFSRLAFQSHNTLRVSVSDSTISARRPTESYSFLFVHFYEYMKNRRITHIFLRDRNNSSGGDGVVLCLRKPVIASPDERRAHDASCTMWTRCCWFLRVVAALHLWLGF